MRTSLHGYLQLLAIVLLLVVSQDALAQVGCGGWVGPTPTGGAISVDNGKLCLNKPANINTVGDPAIISITAANVADGNNPSNFAVEIDWDDGSPRQVVAFGNATIPVTNNGPHSYKIDEVKHIFLPRACGVRPGAECSYRPRVFLRIAGVTCPAQFGTSPDFFRFNTDDQCSGDMVLTEQNSGANVFEVCEGVATTVRFTDRTRLNCLPPQELTALNSPQRWRNFTYGVVNTITGTVLVNVTPIGAPLTIPAAPLASPQPLATSAPPFGVNNTEQITIPATAKAGEEFHIRMNYWNQCNPYPADPAVHEVGIIRVVAQPAPPTPTNQDICNGASYNPFRITVPGGGNDRVFWFRDNSNSPGTALPNPGGNNNSTSYPAASVPGFSNTTAGVYRVWASYLRQVNVAGLKCESVVIPITITVRGAVPVAGPISGDNAVCNGENGIAYSVPNPANTLTPGGPTEFVWDVVNNSNTVVTDVTLTPTVGSGATAQNITAAYNVANGTFGGGGTVIRKIRVRRKFVNSPFCESTIAEFPVTVSRATAIGTMSGGGTFCEGANLGNISWNSPGYGNIVLWQRATAAGGPWSTIGSFGTSNPVSPNSLALTAGTYFIRAQVKNGECPPAFTNAVQYIINPNPAVADAGSNAAICVPAANPLTYTLAGNNIAVATRDWDLISGPTGGTAAFANQTLYNTTVTVNKPGNYRFRWLLDNGSCQSEDEVEIQFGRDPAIPAPTSNSFCGTTGTLNATAPVGGEIILWDLVSGPGTATIVTPDQIPSNVTVSTVGAYTFSLTYSSGSCTPQTRNVIINFYQPATSAPEIDKTVCVDVTNLPASAFAVTGTVGGGALSGQWTTSGTGTFASSGTSTGSVISSLTVADTYTPSAADHTAGAVTFQLVAVHPNAPTCANVSNPLVVTVDKKPANAYAGADNDVCGTTATLNATAPTLLGIGTWSVVTPATLGINDPADRNTGVTNLDFGTNEFMWTVNSALGVCAATTDIVAINRINAPTANNVTPTALCETVANSSTASAQDLTAYNTAITGGSGNPVLWYRNAARTVAVPTPSSEDISDGEIFYVRVNTTGTPVCSSDAIVTFTVTSRPFVANLNPAVCETVAGTGIVDDRNLTIYNGDVSLLQPNRTITWFTDAAVTVPVPDATNVDGVTDGEIFYAKVENTSLGCYNVAMVTFSINPIPADNPILGPSLVCHDPATVMFYTVQSYHPGYSYKWTISSGVTVTTGSTTDFFVLLQFPSADPLGYDISVVETSPEGCPGAVQSLHITVEDKPTASITGPSEVCAFQTDVIFSVPVVSGTYSYAWSVPAGASIILGQGTNVIHVNFGSTPGDVAVIPVTSGGCSGIPATHPVDVNGLPVLAAQDREVCSQSLSEISLTTSSGPTAVSYIYKAYQPDPNLIVMNAAPTPPLGFTLPFTPDNYLYNDQYRNQTPTPLNVQYVVSGVSADGCEGPNNIITVVVKPLPQLDLLSKSICSGEQTGITLTSALNTFPADRFIISSISVPADVTPLVPGNIPTPGSTQYLADVISDDAWINSGASNQTVVYTVNPYSTLLTCQGAPTQVNVQVYPRTIVDPVSVAPLCNGTPLNVTFNSTNNPGGSFHWRVVSYDNWITVGSPASGTGNITNLGIINNLSTADGTVTFEVYGKNVSTEESAAGCSNPIQTFTVTVNRKTQATDQLLSACSDTPGGTNYTANLTTLESAINSGAGTPDVQIKWYASDPTCSCVPVIPVGSLNAYVMTDNTPVFAEVIYVPTGCRAVAKVEYDINPNVSFSTTLSDFTGFNLNCTGDKSGQVRVDVLNGSPVYSYRLTSDPLNPGPWINAGPNVYTFSSLDAGNYTVDVKDAKGCTATSPVLLVEPPVMSATLAEVDPISCFLRQDGSLSTNVTGGTGTYTQYLLLQTNGVDADNDGIFTGLGAATYNVRITDSNGCKVDSSPLLLDQPAAVEINNVSVLTDANGFNLSCRDAVDGEVAMAVSGGNVPNNYTITMTKSSDPGNPIIANTLLHNYTFTGLGAGNYAISAVDAKGCPALPAVAIIVNPPPFSPGFIGINQAVCDGDDAAPINQLVPAFGGVGNYRYQWQLSLTGSMNDAEWIDIPLATSTTYDPGVLAQTTYFRRLASSISARTNTACEILGKDNIVQVTVNPLPVVSFNAPSEVCQGDSFTLLLGMTGGAAPIEYDYSSGSTTFLNMIGTENTMIPVSNFQAAQDYTLLRVKDLNGCLAANVPQMLHVDVIKTNSDFTVLAPAEQCSGGTFSFQWQVEAGVKYTWIWSDGSQDVIVDGERPVGNNTITHVFTSGNTQTSTPYPVRLQAENALCSPKFTTKNITILPSVRLNIIPGDTILCSGESIRFIDQSEGVDNGRWYYRPVGSGEERDVRSGPLSEISYQMFNTTTTNPIFYEVVYEASNTEGCGDTYSQELKVYRGITAGILNTPDPPNAFIGGISTVTFTNNSAPLDDAAFEYTWDFDDAKATPPTGSGINPITVDYFRAGTKSVKLTAVNILSRNENNTCASTMIKPITIMLPTVGAAFKATPLASCFPVNITITNLSPGADTFEWELYDQSGLVGTSNLREPEFRILTPGVYDIYLTASYYATGQTATAVQKGIEVMDVPTALFEMRPNPLYVPDTELQTFNKSARATEYHWDFDDGATSDEFEPRHYYKLEGKYNVVLVAGKDYGMRDIDGDGVLDKRIVCYDTVRNELVALDGGFVKLPNAFTPSANGSTGGIAGNGTFNDVFLPIARGVEEFEMQIFDRWGNMLFESKDRNMGWDGYDKNHKAMPAGVYVYKLIMRLSNGQRTTKIGDVTLIR
ncbi:PKD domain-containing protein [Chryseolinea sp. T2]|uniref:PKD domain-containing protein n=1 Tax=Chryseolinea sp. T2 TaxID=3129255 RepID=UPI003078A470